MIFADYILFLTTALLWGVTNVLIKKNTKGIKEINVENSKWKQIYAEFRYLLTNYKVHNKRGILKILKIFILVLFIIRYQSTGFSSLLLCYSEKN